MSTTPPVVHIKKPTSNRMTSIIPCETPGCSNQRLVGFKYCIDHNNSPQPTEPIATERRGRSSLVDGGKVGAERRCRSPAASRRTSLPIRRAASSTLPRAHVPSDPDKMEYKEFDDLKDVVDPNTVLTRAINNLVRSLLFFLVVFVYDSLILSPNKTKEQKNKQKQTNADVFCLV